MALGLLTTQETKIIDNNTDLRRFTGKILAVHMDFSRTTSADCSGSISLFTQHNNSASNNDAYANAEGLGYGEDDWIG
ncbi:hypothetical protein KY289_011782 [Solanum tuberosum]|nr:hypothetical protein KY289_011782 [Solanum tuberosum]